jgi:hypothetical protein
MARSPSKDRGPGDRVPVTRAQALRFRHRRHGLHHRPGSVDDPARLDLLDYGVQDTGTDGAAWALRVRGLDIDHLDDRYLLAWTLRGAPHAYRRADAQPVTTATTPWSDTDAARRIFDASKPLHDAGRSVLDALAEVSHHERALAAKPLTKGELSTALSERLDPVFLRWCRPCQATHAYEQPFRLAALQAGLELEPGTSPPVLRRARGLRPRHFRPPARVDPRFDVVRNHLRFYGPTTPKHVAEFLDSPVAEVQQRWPDDEVVAVEVAGVPGERHLLAADLDTLRDGAADTGGDAGVRLVGPYDPYLQLRDRELLVGDAARRKDLWRVLGRPGAVVDERGEVIGTWRPKSAGGRLTITVEPWTRLTAATRRLVTGEAERLAAFRGVDLRAVEVS